MRCHSESRLRNGAGLIAQHLQFSCDVLKLRPISARLGTYDYWQLNEHKRRFQDIGTALFLRLARLIRAKMADAEVANTRNVGPDVVTGTSRISFAIEAGRPQTRTLYHWTYPEHDRSRLAVGTFLSVTLIGLRVGQSMRVLDSEDVLGTVEVLAVHDATGSSAALYD